MENNKTFFGAFACNVISEIKKNKWAIMAVWICGLFAHGFAFFNKIIVADDVFYLFDVGETISVGRWGLEILSWIAPNGSMPWLNGAISLMIFTISMCLIVYIFRIKSSLMQFLLAGLIVTFPSQTGVFLYMFTSTAYALAFLLAVLSVYFIRKKSWFYWMLAGVCVVLCMSIYQAYIAIVSSLMLVALIQDAFTSREKSIMLFKYGVGYFLVLCVSIAVYYGVMMLVASSVGDGLNSYAANGLESNTNSILTRIIDAYYCFIYSFTRGDGGIAPSLLMRVSYLLCIVMVVIKSLLFLFDKKRKVLNKCLLLLALGLLPLSMNCMYLFVAPSSIHTLVVYGLATIFVLIAVVYEKIESSWFSKMTDRLVKEILPLGMVVLLFSNIVLSNQVYLKVDLVYKQTYAFYSSLLSEIIDNELFDENTVIAIIDDRDDVDVFEGEFDMLNDFVGSQGVSFTTYAKESFSKYYMGMELVFASKEEAENIRQSSSFLNMNAYPYFGSIKKIDDYLVVYLK